MYYIKDIPKLDKLVPYYEKEMKGGGKNGKFKTENFIAAFSFFLLPSFFSYKIKLFRRAEEN